MADHVLAYKPAGEQLRAFMRDDSFFRGVRGPVGSGKSVACCIEGFRRSSMQAPDKHGVRKTRGAVIRNTNPQLKTTTIKTWLDWFPEQVFGKFRWEPPYTHMIRAGDLEAEIIFLALDRPEDVKKLLSLELTWAWINEAREVSKTIVDAVTMRVNRFPSMKDGGATWAGVWADTNAPDEDHWWPIMAGDVPVPDHIPPEQALMLRKPQGWHFWNQPGGMVEVKTPEGQITGYAPNPLAENARNLPPTYYPQIIQGKTKQWIDVYVLNKLGALNDGKPVYPSFSPAAHKAREAIPTIEGQKVYVGVDFGLTPAAVFAQRDPRGRWLIQHELVAIDMGIARFGEILKSFLQTTYPDCPAEIYGDPAGDFRAQTDETTPFQVLLQKGVRARPAPSNDVALRIEAVNATLLRMIDGQAGLLISPNAKVLIAGFEGAYCYKRLQVIGAERFADVPDKNKYSHVHDACQYLFLGAGEGRALTVGSQPKPATVVSREWDVWQRKSKRGRRPDRSSPWTRRHQP
jgi:hypothetical protein